MSKLDQSIDQLEVAWENSVSDGAAVLFRVAKWTSWSSRPKSRKVNYYTTETDLAEALERTPPEDVIAVDEYRIANRREAVAPQPACQNCGGRGGWEDPKEGQFVSCVRCNGSGLASPQQATDA